MLGRIVEITEDQRFLTVYRGFLVVSDNTKHPAVELGRVAFDDIEALICYAHGLSYTNNVLVNLAERGIPLVICAKNYHPSSMLLPFEGHSLQAARFRAQLGASKPLQKQLWAKIIANKLLQQGQVLETLGLPSQHLFHLANTVKSGDSSNYEAQGARYYWKTLFGDSFRRNQQTDDISNVLLNYGYTVLRSSTARAVMAAGLHPTLAIFHSNEANAMALVDDLIEPFRPIVDICVWRLMNEQGNNLALTPEVKRTLAQCLYTDMITSMGVSPAGQCIQRLAISLVQIYLGERKDLMLPISIA